MFNRIWVLAFILIVGSGQSLAQPGQKTATISRVNALTGRLVKIAKHRTAHRRDPIGMSLAGAIDRLLQNESDPDVLARVALISNVYLHPGSAGDEAVDEVFEVAWGACVRRIEQIGGQPAIDALENIRQNMRLDGSLSMTLSSATERLKAKQGAVGTP